MINIDEVKLLYSSSVHFEAARKYPEGIFAELDKKSIEAWDCAIWAWTKCAEAAELWSRYMGHDPQPIRSEDEWKAMTTPKQLKQMVERLYAAILGGMNCDDPDEAIDMTLIEFKKKLEARA